jgi:hypothetical protein
MIFDRTASPPPSRSDAIGTRRGSRRGQHRQEHQRLVEQIEALKAHGRHHAGRLGIGSPSASLHSSPRYATRDGLPTVRPGRRDFE